MTAERFHHKIQEDQPYLLADIVEILEMSQACNMLPKNLFPVLNFLRKCEGDGVVVFERDKESKSLAVYADVDSRLLQD